MIVVVCVNPTMQNTLVFEKFSQGKVNRAVEKYIDASGKGVNVCRALHQLNADSILFTQTGGAKKDLFQTLCAESGVDAYEIDCDDIERGFEIRTCTTVFDKSKSETTELVEEGFAVPDGAEFSFMIALGTFFKNEKVLCAVVIGSKAQGFSKNFFPEIVFEFLKNEKVVIADFRGNDLINALDRCCSSAEISRNLIVKINIEEFVSTFNVSCSKDNLQKKVLEVSIKYGCSAIITLGSEGCFSVFSGDGEVRFIPAEKVHNVLNTTGCGDSFDAGLASVLKPYFSKEDFFAAIDVARNVAAKNAKTMRPGYLS